MLLPLVLRSHTINHTHVRLPCTDSVLFHIFTYTAVPPTISPEVIDQTQSETDNATFICQATGEPLPTITAYFNGVPVDLNNTAKYNTTMTVLNATTTNNSLTIMNVQSSDVGTYTCNATNLVSSDTSSGVLTVNGEDYFINYKM